MNRSRNIMKKVITSLTVGLVITSAGFLINHLKHKPSITVTESHDEPTDKKQKKSLKNTTSTEVQSVENSSQQAISSENQPITETTQSSSQVTTEAKLESLETTNFKTIEGTWTNVTNTMTYQFNESGIVSEYLILEPAFYNENGLYQMNCYNKSGSGGFTILVIPVNSPIPSIYLSDELSDHSDKSQLRLLISQQNVFSTEDHLNNALFYLKN